MAGGKRVDRYRGQWIDRLAAGCYDQPKEGVWLAASSGGCW